MLISAIVAMTPPPIQLMGINGQLPWHIPEDLQHFKRTTAGHAVLMGRKTFDSIGQKPLPKRRNLIITRNSSQLPITNYQLPNPPEFFPTLDSAIAAVRSAGTETELFIVGGAQIYAAALPLTQRLYITWITLAGLSPEGPASSPQASNLKPHTTHFPPIDFNQWQESSRTTLAPTAELVIYNRK